ncbi:hypothetical protein RIR_jg268.t1 [Rhizophagus irregularis DAOM 181602=DAOM 197198]|nr:hypothetical protein RIR_jg268.t1 [Rhizophagus irregularis DAOM 181602=DAOM 197198]
MLRKGRSSCEKKLDIKREGPVEVHLTFSRKIKESKMSNTITLNCLIVPRDQFNTLPRNRVDLGASFNDIPIDVHQICPRCVGERHYTLGLL